MNFCVSVVCTVTVLRWQEQTQAKKMYKPSCSTGSSQRAATVRKEKTPLISHLVFLKHKNIHSKFGSIIVFFSTDNKQKIQFLLRDFFFFSFVSFLQRHNGVEVELLWQPVLQPDNKQQILSGGFKTLPGCEGQSKRSSSMHPFLLHPPSPRHNQKSQHSFLHVASVFCRSCEQMRGAQEFRVYFPPFTSLYSQNRNLKPPSDVDP